MLRLRILLLLTSLDKCCGVGIFSSNNGSFFGEIFDSVHWEVIYSSDLPALGSRKRKEIRYEKRLIRRITDDKLILKKIT